MKKKYIELMAKALSAYTDEHILRYYNDVKENGLIEHGFPRLTANIGILIAHDIRKDLLPMFIKMMDLCCDMFLRPFARAANEFSVREIVFCIDEVERANSVEKEDVLRWKEKISKIIPEQCYNLVVKDETDLVNNFVIFSALSEYARFYFGLGENLEFIDRQLSSQMKLIGEEGMYRDNIYEYNHQPLMYDIVARVLFATLLHFGYRGKYHKELDDCLKKGGLLTLKMQSTNGEAPFGGRSYQFVHNEPLLIGVLEYEANRYAKEGNMQLARAFKSAIARALSVTESWLDKKPVSHIKNRFPIESKFGCEHYAYFDKYMITVASNIYLAYLMCDDSIPTVESVDHQPIAFQTTDYFHKLFLKSGGYMIEIETNADPHYDANGLGRVHREGAPSTICLSVPCPSHPEYEIDVEQPIDLSICSGIKENGEWRFATDSSVSYETTNLSEDKDSAQATVVCHFSNKQSVATKYKVSADGVHIELNGNGDIACMLPAFLFDGETYTKINADEHSLSISYEGWCCKYTVDGIIKDLDKIAVNRNGHYRAYMVTGKNNLKIKIEITKE